MVNPNASGHRSAFSQTCNLLRQFVKEKKAVGELSLGIRGQNDAFRPTTMSLFPVKPNSMDLFPQLASQSSEVQSSPMTIFYAGQVIVINDFPAHKAKEIMDLARRGVNPKSTSGEIPVVINNTSTNIISQQIKESAQQSTTPIITDLPIARKASLHRFLEKRKDRIKAKAPYSMSKPGNDGPLKNEERNPWLGLAASAAPPS